MNNEKVRPGVRAAMKTIESQMQKYDDNESIHLVDSGNLHLFLDAANEMNAESHYTWEGGVSYRITVSNKDQES